MIRNKTEKGKVKKEEKNRKVLKELVNIFSWGAWVAQSVKHLTSAQVRISWLVGSSPVLGSVLRARSPEPALDSVSPSLSAPPLLVLCLSLSLKNKEMFKKLK